MMQLKKVILDFIDVLKYKRQEYSVLYVAMMFCPVLAVLKLSENVNFTDMIALGFSAFFLMKTLGNSCNDQRLAPPPHTHTHKYGYYIYPLVFIIIAMIGYVLYGTTRMMLSQFRFIFNCTVFVVIYTYFHNSTQQDRERLISSYIYVCVLLSMVVIIQYLSFYLLHYNINLDIGDNNSASSYVFSESAVYRTGGLFNEPSWHALFVGPVLAIASNRKKYMELFLCIVGLMLSTSSMGFLFVFIFAVFNVTGKNKKYVFWLIMLSAVIYWAFPAAFERLFEALNFDDGVNSNDARVISPMTVAFSDTLPLFGMNVDRIYAAEEGIFLNTFVFVLLVFGIIGLLFFVSMIFKKRFLLLSAILLCSVIIEGCYGRIDFWMALLAASVFCDCLKIDEKRGS